MPRYAPYSLSFPSSPSPSDLPSGSIQTRAQRRASADSSTFNGGLQYVPYRFEVIPEPAIDSPPTTRYKKTTNKGISQTRVSSALDRLHVALTDMEEELSGVNSLREQQAAALIAKERELKRLKTKQGRIADEMFKKTIELEAIEAEILLFSERKEKIILRPRTNESVKEETSKSWSQTFRRSLRLMPTRSFT